MNTLAADMSDNETAAALYLAKISLWHDEPECVSIGATGSKSRALTETFIQHLAMAGHLPSNGKTLKQYIFDRLRVIGRKLENWLEGELTE